MDIDDYHYGTDIDEALLVGALSEVEARFREGQGEPVHTGLNVRSLSKVIYLLSVNHPVHQTPATSSMGQESGEAVPVCLPTGLMTGTSGSEIRRADSSCTSELRSGKL
jgi:hypothetical protein